MLNGLLSHPSFRCYILPKSFPKWDTDCPLPKATAVWNLPCLGKERMTPLQRLQRDHESGHALCQSYELSFNSRNNCISKNDAMASETVKFLKSSGALTVLYHLSVEIASYDSSDFFLNFSISFPKKDFLFKSENLKFSAGNILIQSLLEEDKYSVWNKAWNYPYWETDVEVISLWDAWWRILCPIWILISSTDVSVGCCANTCRCWKRWLKVYANSGAVMKL